MFANRGQDVLYAWSMLYLTERTSDEYVMIEVATVNNYMPRQTGEGWGREREGL